MLFYMIHFRGSRKPEQIMTENKTTFSLCQKFGMSAGETNEYMIDDNKKNQRHLMFVLCFFLQRKMLAVIVFFQCSVVCD